MRRWLVRLLVFMLVPLVGAASTRAADAAADIAYTPAVGVTWKMDGAKVAGVELFGATCAASFMGQTVAGGWSIYVTNGYCQGGADVTPGYCQVMEASCTHLTYRVQATGCGSTGLTSNTVGAVDGPHNSLWHVTMDQDGGAVIPALPMSCDPTNACLKLTADDGAYNEVCMPIALDPPKIVNGSCKYGTVHGMVVPGALMNTVNFTKWWGANATALIDGGASQPDTPHGWAPYVVVKQNDPSATPINYKSVRFPGVYGGATVQVNTQVFLQVSTGTVGNQLAVPYSTSVSTSDGQTIPAVTGKVIGFGYVAHTSGSYWTVPTVVGSAGLIGVTDPTRCAFYFGDKIAKTGLVTDEPAGPLDAPAAPTPVDTHGDPNVALPDTPATCEGDNSDSANCSRDGLLTWIGKILALILQAIVAVGDAIAGLVGAIIDGLTGMFVPSSNPFTSGLALFQSDVDHSRLSDWTDGVSGAFGGSAGTHTGSGFSVGSAGVSEVGGSAASSTAAASFTTGGGCSGPGITWDYFGKAGLPSTIHPVAACDGIAATAAGYSRTFLTVIVSVMGLVKCVSLLLVSFGGLKQTDTLLSHDWGSDHVIGRG
ncbi:MAG: hypothetical protein ACOYBY_17765 [Dermatophilaceae bacterium]